VSPILIVGYGNPLRGDDGLGRRAAEELAGRWPESEVRVEAAHQLFVEMAPAAAESDFAVFIDAGRDGAPGEVRAVPVRSVEFGASSLTHHVTPETLLAVAQSLYGRRPDAILATIAGEDFGHGEKLSSRVERAMPELLARVTALVENRLKERAHA
jgi:hydrogenase maturation protease